MRKSSALFAALFCFVGAAFAEIPPAEKLLPDDTVFMLTIPDFNKARGVLADSPVGGLWNDPAIRDFKKKLVDKFQSEYLTPLEHDLGISFSDYTNLPQGQLTFAMTQNDWLDKNGSPGNLILLDTKGKSSQLKTNLADLKKKWVDAGKTVKTENIRGVDFSVVTLSAADLPKTFKKKPVSPPGAQTFETDKGDSKDQKSPLYIGQSDSLLIVGNSPKPIEKILARMAGGSVASLSELSSFDANAGMFRNAPLFGWVNMKAIMDAVNHSGESDGGEPTNPFGFRADKVMAALGFSGLKSIAFDYVSTSDGLQFNVQFNVPESARTGLFKILAGEPKDCNPPPFVPADAVKFQRWRIDGQKTYATLRKMLSDVSPAIIGLVDTSLNAVEGAAREKDPKFDLNKSLIGNLGDDVINYSKAPKGQTLADLSSPPSIFLIGSPNPEQLADAVKNIIVAYSQTSAPKDREFLGHKVYSIPLPGQPTSDGTTGPPRALSYACSGGYLAITTDTSLLEEYLRSSETPPKPLRDFPGLSDATQKVIGGGTSLFGFSNENEANRAMFDLLKKDSSTDLLASLTPLTMAMGMDVKPKDWIDLSLLPTFDQVSKYFYFQVYALNANSDGINFKVFAPTPPQLKK